MKKKRRKTSLSKIKIFFSVIVFASVTAALGYDCLTNILKIHNMKNEKEQLEIKLLTLHEEKATLKDDILRLQDPEYIAKYVREKYFYSKDGEYILRLD